MLQLLAGRCAGIYRGDVGSRRLNMKESHLDEGTSNKRYGGKKPEGHRRARDREEILVLLEL
jgi:hypothetical protein